MDAVTVCATCAGSGFLLDKMPLFPFLAGLAAGVTFVISTPGLVSMLSEKLGFIQLPAQEDADEKRD